MLESLHTYPRRLRLLFELISTVLVLTAALLAARTLLQWWWATFALDRTLFSLVPGLARLVTLIGVVDARTIDAGDIAQSLGWLAAALLLAIMLRNALPTVRTSTQGLLVEFGGGWLPISYDQLRAARVTQDTGGKRFVVMIETKQRRLTDWHRIYGLLYHFSLRRGFWISSSISDFEGLIRTIISESERIARVLENVEAVRLDERSPSPLLGFLLSPAGFFGRRTPADDLVAGLKGGSSPSRGSYPARIGSLLRGGTLLLSGLAVLSYILTMLRLLRLQFPLTDRLLRPYLGELYDVPNRLWLLVAAHLTLLLALASVAALRALLPDVEVRSDGLALRSQRGWHTLPWRQVVGITDTEVSEGNHILLLEAGGGLPWTHRLAGLLYGGRLRPGVLVTSALSNFEPIMQRVVLEASRARGGVGSSSETPLLRSNDYSRSLLLTLRPGPAIDRLVEEARSEDPPPPISAGRLLAAARPMALVTLLPALLYLVELALHQGRVPTLAMLVTAAALWLFGMIEWPLVSLISQVFDEGTAPSAEGNRGLYLYPTVQLPRAVALGAALLLLLTAGNLPVLGTLPLLLWLGAIIWSFVLAAGLWESLYDWRGSQLLIGGAAPAIYQLLVLLAYLAAT